MSELIGKIVLSIIVIGLGVAIFTGTTSLKQTVIDGHVKQMDEVRSWGYSAN